MKLNSSGSGAPVVAWLGPSQREDPVKVMALQLLHSSVIRDRTFQAQTKERCGSGVSAHTSTFFKDLDRCIATIGLAEAGISETSLARDLSSLWIERAAGCAQSARQSLDGWMTRQTRFDPMGKPYGSRMFRRIRDAALFGGNVELAANPGLMRELTRTLLASSAQSIVEQFVHGPCAVL
jgi:hypothetical protein